MTVLNTTTVFAKVLVPVSLLVVFLSFHVTDAKPPESLRMVHYLFRHGDRSPTHGYTGDPNPPSTWPRGLGQLSQTGMRQLYQLGLYMRQRYDGFLNPVYQPDEIAIVSTDVDRTIQSAQSHLAGLYVPTKRDLWNQAIAWQPIAVHSRPKEVDDVMAVKNCPKLKQLRKEVWNLPYYKEITTREQPFINWISGKVNRQYTMQNMYQLKDPIYVEYLHNLTLPSFVNESTVERLVFFDLIAFKSQSHTEQLQRLSGGGGPLINDVLKRVRQKIRGDLVPDLKAYVYSGHDSTITAFLQTIKNFNDICPPFAAVVIIELHEVDGQFHLEILYRNDTKSAPLALAVPGCDFKCPLDKFEDLLRPAIADDLMAECALETVEENTTFTDTKHLLILFACLAAILTAIVVFQMVMILTMRKAQQRQNDYDAMGSNL